MEKNSAPGEPLSDAETISALQGLVCKHLSMLTEHFDSVQILCTKKMPTGRTEPFTFGEGDWFARFGLASTWVENGKAYEHAAQLRRFIIPPEG